MGACYSKESRSQWPRNSSHNGIENQERSDWRPLVDRLWRTAVASLLVLLCHSFFSLEPGLDAVGAIAYKSERWLNSSLRAR